MKQAGGTYEIRQFQYGYRIWNRRVGDWWGDVFEQPPTQIVAELNGRRHPDRIRVLVADAHPVRRSPLLG